MGYYYTDRPPEEERGWKKYIPRWLKRLWADAADVIMISKVTLGLILPIIGVLFGFVLLCFVGMFLLSICGGSS